MSQQSVAEFFALKGRAQFVFEFLLLARHGIHRRLEEAVGRARFALGPVKRKVGIAMQCFR